MARVLIVHNRYRCLGGEDMVVEEETELLKRHGNEVSVIIRHNDELKSLTRWRAAGQTLWSSASAQRVTELIRAARPDLIHVHNTFPLVSPVIYWVAARHRIPVVQTLHNFRLLCAQAMFLREERTCEECLGRLPWRGVIRGCYRDSRSQSAVLVAMLGLHRALGTYRHKVTRYIALNHFCRNKFIAGGLPADRVTVKPNFVDAPSSVRRLVSNRFLFVGRLSPEKGVKILAVAASRVPGAVFEVVGEGPEAGELAGVVNVERRGLLPLDAVMRSMAGAACLVMPSLWYENFPRTLVEAFAAGLPVIASRIGALAELVRDGETGLLFTPGDPDDLAAKVRWALANPEAVRAMGEAARREYETKYTPEVNYQQLMRIYEDAIRATRNAQA